MKNFAEIVKRVKSIHVWMPPSNSAEGGVTQLTRKEHDKRCQYYNDRSIVGSGTEEYPYKYEHPGTASPHWSIISLWCRYADKDIYISCNGWVVRCDSEGVYAGDDVFTKFT